MYIGQALGIHFDWTASEKVLSDGSGNVEIIAWNGETSDMIKQMCANSYNICQDNDDRSLEMCKDYHHATYRYGAPIFSKACGYEFKQVTIFVNIRNYAEEWYSDDDILCRAPQDFLKYCTRAKQTLVIILVGSTLPFVNSSTTTCLTQHQFTQVLQKYKAKREKMFSDLRDPKFRCSEYSSLSFCLFLGYSNMAEELIKNGVDVNFGNPSPLVHACAKNFPEVTRRLVENGADINYCKMMDGRTFNPLLEAVVNGYVENVKILLECKTQQLSLDVRDKRDKEIDPNNASQTALTWAVVNNSYELVNLLLQRGASISLTNDNGRTALYWANRLKHTKISEFLQTYHPNTDSIQQNSTQSASTSVSTSPNDSNTQIQQATSTQSQLVSHNRKREMQ